MVLDTSAMLPGAADLRFGADSAGATLLDYWIESGAGTASTIVWVKLPPLAASATSTIYMFSGNPAATSASTINVFDTDTVDPLNVSATRRVDTVGSADVTNIAVTCATNTYTIGGNVSGLAGSGMILSLNSGAQTLNVSGNGAFVFATAIDSGASYAVTVQTQPSAPAQTCGVTADAGVVGAASVTTVVVTCSALVRNVSFTLPAGIIGTTPAVPTTVPDGQVLSFTINVAPGYQLISATGCGGSLNGFVYTTAAVTGDCAISAQVVALAADTAQVVPTGASAWLLLTLLAFAARFATQRRRLGRQHVAITTQ
jgi:Domain of unknown function (DUF2341)